MACPSYSLQTGMNLHSHEKWTEVPAPWGTLMYFVISYVGVFHSDLQRGEEQSEERESLKISGPLTRRMSSRVNMKIHSWLRIHHH